MSGMGLLGTGSELKRKWIFSSLRATGSRECAPDDKLREAIQNHRKGLDCVVACAPRNDKLSILAAAIVAGTRTDNC
jgi:hypothetical protein